MTTTAAPGSDLSHASPSRPPPSRSYSTRRDPSHSSRPSTAASVSSNSASALACATASASYHQALRSHHQRRPSSHRSASQVATPPQHDYDTTRIASHSKRSSSRDVPRGNDPNRPHRRSSSRCNYPHPQQTPDMPSAAAASAAPPPSSHGRSSHAGTDAQSSHGTKQSRSRTTIPTQSGKWILGKTIGAGSMGKVKLARKEDGSEQVACKIIPRGSTDDAHQTRADKERADQSKEIRTAREAAIVTLLNHPHICGLRDVVRTNYHWYMLFEFVNGGQMLDYIISHGKLKEKQARKFSRQIASALDYCHRNSIVHRDLKIENILISKTGDIKIIDFGLSNLFAPRGHLKTFCGSLYFAAPELLQARAYTGPEVDVWSFGIVLYVLVCGKVPFDDHSMPALHAKIKKGVVDYPSWLSSECKHLMSRMLVTDPKQRATMQEVMIHPWMTKGYSGPPDNYLPIREPLTLPLEPEVVHAMQGFNFGSPESINAQLTKIIESEDYQQAVRLYYRERKISQQMPEVEKKKSFGFDFYKRRNSGSASRDTLTHPSSDALQLGSDPLNAFSPLLSIYYLVREKQTREQENLMTQNPASAKEKEKQRERERERDRERDRDRDARDRLVDAMPLAPPKAAHTNAAAFEMPGEKPTGGRTRPRARTHGEDDEPDMVKQQKPQEKLEPAPKKEGTAAGLLRRFSTRKRRDPQRHERDRSHPPMVHVHSPSESSPIPPRKSFSMRRTRPDPEELRSGGSQQHHKELLSPPLSSGGRPTKSGLGRSTSVNSGDTRRRDVTRVAREQAVTSGSDQSVENDLPRSAHKGHNHSQSMTTRAKSLGHARRESVQRRRHRRENAMESNVPEETDVEIEQSGQSTERLATSDLAKPVFLKGLFSVSTTSGKSVPAIRAEIRRVLDQLNVEYIEIKGGFSCRHSPSIDLNKVQDPPGTAGGQSGGHRRRFSFGGLRRGDDRDDSDRGPLTPRTPARSDRDRSDRDKSDRERSYSNSETSLDSIPRTNGGTTRRAPGETSTQVQSDLGGSMILEFEIFIVKVPLLSLHGIQFKRMEGNTWQFKNMADQILKELKL
ncbi:hypothetical protein BB8028_0004g07000 [Beauveria bassiana]|uniref:non-specific serine/threonine protein kinase n=1 Tax=Beauveria bassiana TaxID=176275 RepID=A0A2S7YCN4_BEABA|nr:hypothetical protein BB8028_0004g07000 [Beauveria bassiana]